MNTHRPIRMLTYLMFFIFAMTTDAVGVIIPVIIEAFDLSLTQASAFHYGTMLAIALSGIGLGFLSDRYGRKAIIILGLGLFAACCFAFAMGSTFAHFLTLVTLSGLAIGIFKTAAIGLMGDISSDSGEHTRTMNMAEGFFAVGAIVGPAVVSYLLQQAFSWTYLYVFAGGLALLLALTASRTQYPQVQKTSEAPTTLADSLRMLKDPYALGFSFAIALYVITEAAIYVWMPTYLLGYSGDWGLIATYALSIFFVFRALGRFLGAYILHYFQWQSVLALFTGAVALCYVGAMALGVNAAALLLPLSGLFMSVLYPTINSKGISCFPTQQHGAIAGVILFFTAIAAALGPMVMGLLGDIMGDVFYGFVFTACCAVALFLLALVNLIMDPTSARLTERPVDRTTG
jgi:DHA1 family quinolone resistance protein-like MFS transporter